MYRRIAFAAAALSFALPAGAVAAEPPASTAGGVAASGPKLLAVKASKSGRTVLARVRWDQSMLSQGERERFTVRLLSGQPRQRRAVGSIIRRSARSTVETIRFRLSVRNARRVKSAPRVIATATQQFDGADEDRLFERNRASIAALAGKPPLASASRACDPKEITPGADMSDCQLPGVNLAGAELAGVNFSRADLELSILAGADLSTARLTQADLTGALLVGARMSADEQSALTFPDDGEKIEELIDSAKTSVDIIIYDFAGPNIVGQRSRPGALMRAVQRGVNVRVIVNSSSSQCPSARSADQSRCASDPKYDGLYAAQASLRWASQNPDPGRAPGRYRVQFSSQNYQVTHQKSILIDTSDSNGVPLTAAQMVPTSLAMVSTGNLKSAVYENGTGYAWGDHIRGGKVVNRHYLSDPASSCYGGAPACTEEWAARDFAIEVTRTDLLERLAAVYAADQTCKKWEEAPVYRQLLDSDLPDTWANGTLVAGGTTYPAAGTDAFYAGAGPNRGLEADPTRPNAVKPQGNSRQRQIQLIDSAKSELVVYNEEMADADIVNALVRAADRLGKGNVRVVMSAPFQDGKPNPKTESTAASKYPPYFLSYLVSNGVEVNLLPADADGVVYIHAKAIVADGLNAFIGSENFGYASMNYNRELGLMLTNSTDPSVRPPAPSLVAVGAIAEIMTAFEKDWNNSKAVAWRAVTPTPTVRDYADYPKPPYPQPYWGTPFRVNPPLPSGYNFNMSCLTDPGGDRYLPRLPTRTPPPFPQDKQ